MMEVKDTVLYAGKKIEVVGSVVVLDKKEQSVDTNEYPEILNLLIRYLECTYLKNVYSFKQQYENAARTRE